MEDSLGVNLVEHWDIVEETGVLALFKLSLSWFESFMDVLLFKEGKTGSKSGKLSQSSSHSNNFLCISIFSLSFKILSFLFDLSQLLWQLSSGSFFKVGLFPWVELKINDNEFTSFRPYVGKK